MCIERTPPDRWAAVSSKPDRNFGAVKKRKSDIRQKVVISQKEVRKTEKSLPLKAEGEIVTFQKKGLHLAMGADVPSAARAVKRKVLQTVDEETFRHLLIIGHKATEEHVQDSSYHFNKYVLMHLVAEGTLYSFLAIHFDEWCRIDVYLKATTVKKTLESERDASDEEGEAVCICLKTGARKRRQDHSRRQDSPESTKRRRWKNKLTSLQSSDGDDDRRKTDTSSTDVARSSEEDYNRLRAKSRDVEAKSRVIHPVNYRFETAADYRPNWLGGYLA